MKKRATSLGLLISNAVFFIASVWLFYEAFYLIAIGEVFKGVIVFGGAFLSLVATFRVRIQHLVEKLRENN